MLKPSSPAKLRSLNALRFLAAAAVFGAHLFFLAGNPSTQPLYTLFLVKGASGVTFFFILSGFILAYGYRDRLLGARRADDALGRFYLARFARIYPVHLLTIGCAALLSGLTVCLSRGPELLANLLLLHAWVPSLPFMGAFNQVSWSLSHEAFFYLLFPVLLPFILMKRLTLVLAGVGLPALGLLAIAVFAPSDYHYFFHLFPPVRLIEFVSGMLLFRLLHDHGLLEGGASSTANAQTARFTLLEVGAVALVGTSVALSNYVTTNLAASLLYIPAFSAVIAVFALARGKLSAWLAHPFAFHLGEISYSFYMFHLLVLIVMVRHFSAVGPIGIIVGGFMATLVVSHLCYTFFEVPLRNRINNWLPVRYRDQAQAA